MTVTTPVVAYRVDGFKVEAIARGAVDQSLLTIGTDDERFGGTWRPLLAPDSASTRP